MTKRKPIKERTKHKVFAKDSYTCRACGFYDEYGHGLTVDHIVPVSKGGKNEINNYQCLCVTCNAIKGAAEVNELPIRQAPNLDRSYKEYMQEVNANRQTFYALIHPKSAGWFMRREATLALLDKQKRTKEQDYMIRKAISETFDLRKHLLDIEPFKESYRTLVLSMTPASAAEKDIHLAYV